MTIETIPFDAAEHLDRDSSKLFVINDALQSGDVRYITTAIGAVARSSGGLSLLERLTGIKRQTLNKSFGKDGNPTLETLLTVLKALHLQLKVEQAEAVVASGTEGEPPRRRASA